MQLYSRLSANLLAISVKIVNLLVELTELGQGGPSGAGAPGIDKLVVGMFLVVLLLVNLFGGPKARPKVLLIRETMETKETKRKETATPLRLSPILSDFLGMNTIESWSADTWLRCRFLSPIFTDLSDFLGRLSR